MRNHSAPIFIIGSQRSGTTLLRLILNAHSKIAIPEEGTFWMPLIRSLKGKYEKPIPKAQFANYIKYIKNNDQFNAWFMVDCKILDELMRRDEIVLRDLMEALYLEYARINKKTVWGDKTPSFFRKVNELHAIFSNARFINIIRDGRDVYLSMKNRLSGRGNIAVAALEWRYKVKKVEEAFSRLPQGRTMEIRFEDLLTSPYDKIKGICDFLGVQYEDEMLKFYESSHKFIGEHHSELIFKPISDSSAAKWKKKLSPSDNRIFEFVAYDCLKKHGYEIINDGKFNALDRVKAAAMLFTGLPRRAAQVFKTALILKFCSMFGIRTSAAGGKAYFES